MSHMRYILLLKPQLSWSKVICCSTEFLLDEKSSCEECVFTKGIAESSAFFQPLPVCFSSFCDELSSFVGIYFHFLQKIVLDSHCCFPPLWKKTFLSVMCKCISFMSKTCPKGNRETNGKTATEFNAFIICCSFMCCWNQNERFRINNRNRYHFH